MLQHNSNQAWCQRIKMYRSWPSICASMRPFICSTSIFTMARPKPVFWPVRIALTGLQVTPGGADEAATLLGQAEALRRLCVAEEKLKGELANA